MVVVGGGIAGLTAARDLLRQGKSVVVLEAQTTLGGRSERTHVTLSDGSEVPCTLPQCIKPDGSVNGKWWWDIGGELREGGWLNRRPCAAMAALSARSAVWSEWRSECCP